MNGDHLSNWVIPAAVSVIVTAIGASVVWGEYGERIQNLKSVQLEVLRQLDEIHKEQAKQDTEIALLNQRMTDCEKK
jgi:hypothetical protein